jgi:hypothetical protein
MMTDEKMTVEAAIAAGSVRAKVSLLAAQDVEEFVRDFKARVDLLSKNHNDNFEMVKYEHINEGCQSSGSVSLANYMLKFSTFGCWGRCIKFIYIGL